MLKNYLKIAIRSLFKNGVYSFINIAGLSIGLTCSVLILLWVNNELSWDDFHEKKNNLYRVYINGEGDNGIYTQRAIALPVWEELKADRDIKYVAPTNWGQTYLLTYGENRLYKSGYYAGDDFLKMFSFPIVKGATDNQLKDPSSIVITESTAKSLFREEDPIGKVIRVDDLLDLTVTGVIKDIPSNSTFQFECLIPFSTYMNRESWIKESLTNWGNNSFNMYAEFDEKADPQEIENRVKGIIKKHEANTTHEVTFLSMNRWRLYSEFKNGKSVSGDIVYVRLFSIIATFILVIACINFMNLATARSERRAREVGIRKSIGSKRKELIVQFLGETLFIATIAFIIAIALVQLGLPFYNQLVDKKLFIDFSNPLLWLGAVGVILITGLIAGSYPAFYLSSFQPAAVLKGRMQAGKKGAIPRKVMVTLQFFFSIVLIIATLVIYLQIDHLRNRPTGYDQDQLMMVSVNGDVEKNYKAIKNELIDNGLASAVSTSSSPITAIYSFMGAVTWQGKREDQRASMATVATSLDYTKTMGIKIIQGRDFAEEYNDSLSVMLNESAVKYMELKNPLEETIHWDDKDYRIVGVLEDVIMTSPQAPVDPAMFLYDPTWLTDVSLRLSKENNPQESLAKIEAVFKKYNPAYPFTYRFADDEFNRKFTNIQMIGRLANLFSALAIIISCLGLFGLAAFTAEQRTKEIGIRKVLGATVSSVVVLISKDFTRLIILAFVLASPLAWWAMNNWLKAYSYRINIEWWILATAGALTLAVALIVVSFQAIKAAVSNPVKSLRSE
ncbi:MAG TPA: ABC transporter permease [Cyclobacteriaceae bacterium]